MNTLFVGLGISLGYGIVGTASIFIVDNRLSAQQFFTAYTLSFKTLFAFGLIAGTALIVFRSQSVIPQTIELAFSEEQLSRTEYFTHKQRFLSRRRSITFAADFVAVAFIVFSSCQFPLSRYADALMVAAACAQYALGVYVGRKLFYAGMMLQSLQTAPVTRNLFKKRELDDINLYVHIVSTLTVMFVYVHVIGYYDGPFLYGSVLGTSVKPFLILPAVIATPVLLIFNFYPRAVLRRIYSKSIDIEVRELQTTLKNETLSEFEKRSCLIEFDKMSRDELRYSLQLTLADLPIGITILIMLLQPLLKH